MTDPQAAEPDADPVSELLEQILALPAAEREAALARAQAARPAEATALGRRFANLRTLGLLDDEDGSADGLAIPERLGEFVLEARIGGGGMGVVFRARQTSLHRTVALKLVRPELLFFPGARERFVREAEAVGRLAHPGIVPVFTAGTAQGVPYLAMELVAGHTLADALQTLAGRDPARVRGAELGRAFASTGSLAHAAAELGVKLAEALAHAHERGVLHRDVKPSNVMLAADGRILLLDFGLAFAEGDARLTRSQAQLGSLAYAAPELCGGDPRAVDARADVFSLGALLHEVVTLQPAFLAATPTETLQRVLHAEVPSLLRGNPEAPRDLAAIVARMLEKDRARRYPTMAECAADLRAFLDHRPVRARLPGPFGRGLRWARRDPKRLALVAALPLVLAALGYAVVTRRFAEVGREHLASVERERLLERGFFELARGSRAAARKHFEEVLLRHPEALEAAEARSGLALTAAAAPASRPAPSPRASPAEHFEAAVAHLRAAGREGDAERRRALAWLELAIERSPVQRALYHFERAEAAARIGDPALVERVAVTLRTLWPEHPLAAFWLGSLRIGSDPAVARAEYERAVRLDPTLARAWSDLGVLALQRGELAVAEAHFARALALQPDNAWALLDRAICALQRGDPNAALVDLAAAAVVAPELPGIAYHEGLARLAAGQRDAATSAFRRATTLAPDYVEAWQNLAVVLEDRDPEGARRVLEAGLAANPRWADGWLLLAHSLRASGVPKDALPALRRYVELVPGDAETKRHLAELEALSR